MSVRVIIFLILSTLLPSRLAAFVRSGAPVWSEGGVAAAYEILSLHPLRGSGLPPRWALYEHGLLDLQGYGELLLREQGLDYGLEIVAQRRNRHRVDYRYRLQGHDVCDLRTALTRLRDGRVYQRGRYPTAQWHGGEHIWPSRALAFAVVEQVFAPRAVRVDGVARCLLATVHGYVPVYDISVRVGVLPYRVRTDGYELLEVQRWFYDLQGELYVYRENAVRNDNKERFLIDIDQQGRLTNRYFDTVEYEGNSSKRIDEPSNVFNYDDTDPKMAHVSAFAHANLMLEWFAQQGFRWYGSERVVLAVHANVNLLNNNYNPNNAFYAPPQYFPNGNRTQPHILIGDGDGRSLQNLALDGDVIAHEFAHHVIFQYLPATSGEAGAIHEGLADYFTFAKTNDPCLAESICPEDSAACQLDGQCMRYATHGYSWHELRGLGVHIEGQVLSALLWDLRTSFGISADVVNSIAFNSVRHFTPVTKLRQFIDALLIADRDLFGGRNCVSIINATLSRGLQQFLSPDIKCSNGENSTTLIEKASAERASASQEGYQRRDRSCGTIASPATSPYVLILLPLLFCLVGNIVIHRRAHPSNARAFRR